MTSADEQAVLFANEAFYQAFASGDYTAMEEVWARTAPVSCLHPGWGPLHGRIEVMESWSRILAEIESTDLACRNARADIVGNTAIVTCFEEMDEGFLIATNIFIREDGGWRMLHHHAGPTADEPEEDAEPVSLHLH